MGNDSIGLSGGLFLCRSNKIIVQILFSNNHSVCCKVRDECNELSYFVCVYGAPNVAGRSEIWNTLRDFIQAHPQKLVLLGDFNQLENSTQKMGGNSFFPGANSFTKWRMDCNLMDIPYHGVNFTWTKNRENEDTVFERIDRAYCNDLWRTAFPEPTITNYPIFLSDHGPIILDCHPKETKRRRPYRIESWRILTTTKLK